MTEFHYKHITEEPEVHADLLKKEFDLIEEKLNQEPVKTPKTRKVKDAKVQKTK
jgi:hypothetical protein